MNRRCRVRSLRARLPSLLAAAAVCGETFSWVHEGTAWLNGESPRAVDLRRLGVVQVTSRELQGGDSPEALIYIEGVTGPPRPDWKPVIAWLESFLWASSRADVIRKLASSPEGRGAVVIGLTMSTDGSVYFAVDGDSAEVPVQDPQLPSEVYEVWLITLHGRQRCLHWRRGCGWDRA